jgi:hypothetical protein
LFALFLDDIGEYGFEYLQEFFKLFVADFASVLDHVKVKFDVEEGVFLGVFVVFDEKLETVGGCESLRKVAGELIVDFGHVDFLFVVGGEELLTEGKLFGEDGVGRLELLDRVERKDFALVLMGVVSLGLEKDFVE